MLRRLFLTSCLLIFLTACAPATVTPFLPPTLTFVPNTAVPSASPLLGPADSSPTPEIFPTALQETSSTPTLTIEPTIAETLQLLPTLKLPLTLTATEVPQPAIDSGAIQLFGPGPLSKVISPLAIYGYAIPGFDNKGRVDLYGEDGRLLASQILQLNTTYKWAYFNWALSFDVSTAGELGRLTMSTQDQYGRVNAIYSIHLLLLPEGSSIVNPPGNLRERCVIEQPVAGKRVSGGVLTIAGKMRPFNNLPLTVALVARDGSVVNSQLLAISPLGDSYVPFRVDIPYSISSGTWELLVVSQFDDRIGGLMYLYSREIFLNP
jgi:hypothetical protein